MSKYKWITVCIPVEEGGPLDRRIQAYCEAVGANEQSVAEYAAKLGITGHMHNNLALMERGLKGCAEG